ncbi:hypothetical protein FJ366_00010 [Candidatus Dependentiae bacterium]|nr:hypothetical protein [Candidatus Dependentiae bacterium]
MNQIITLIALIFLISFPHYLLLFSFSNMVSALIAKFFGDKEPEREGFLSFNIDNHVNIENLALFILMMSLASSLLYGDGTNSLARFMVILLSSSAVFEPRINPENYKNNFHAALAILGKPLGRFFYSLILLIIMQTIPINIALVSTSGTWQSLIWLFLDQGVNLSLYFALVELLPFPLFASGKIIEMLMTEEQKKSFDWFFEYGNMVFMALIILPGISSLYFMWMHKKAFIIKHLLNSFIIGTSKTISLLFS